MTNYMSFVSDSIETRPEQFLTHASLPDSRNLFGKEGVEIDEIDESHVKLKTTTFAGNICLSFEREGWEMGGRVCRLVRLVVWGLTALLMLLDSTSVYIAVSQIEGEGKGIDRKMMRLSKSTQQ